MYILHRCAGCELIEEQGNTAKLVRLEEINISFKTVPFFLKTPMEKRAGLDTNFPSQV